MRTRTIEIGKTGIYGTVDNPKVVTSDHLREIHSTWPDVRRAPISLTGHKPDAKAGRLGGVTALHLNEDASSLVATVEEHDVLAKAVDDGFYPDRSLGAQRRASDGKLYLHHVAYLGEEPPAIKDLRDDVDISDYTPAIAAADNEGELIVIPPIRDRILHLADPAKKAMQQISTKEKTMELEEALAALEKEKAKTLELSDQVKKKGEELVARDTVIKSKDELLSKLTAKHPDEPLLLADSADPRVATLHTQLRKGKAEALRSAAAGKLPKGKAPLLDALIGTLSAAETIELSDGDKKVNVDGFDLVTKIFAAIPSPVQAGVLQLSDPEDKTLSFSPREALKAF